MLPASFPQPPSRNHCSPPLLRASPPFIRSINATPQSMPPFPPNIGSPKRMELPTPKDLEISSPEVNRSAAVQKAHKCEDGALPLPETFLTFLKQNQIDPSLYKASQSLPRYIRFKLAPKDEILSLQKDTAMDIAPVSWLPGFFHMAAEANIAGLEAYKHGKIYGMDAASGAAVTALDVSLGDNVLDICAAPGAKLCMIADLLGSTGSLTGVDITRHRLAACRTMLQKYGLGSRCRLFLADGTTFSLLPPLKPNIISNMDKQPNQKKHSQGLPLNRLQNFAVNGVEGEHDNYPGISSVVLKEWTSRKTRKEKRAEKRARLLEEKNQQAFCLSSDTSRTEQLKIPEIFFYGRESGMVGMEQSVILNHTVSTDASSSQKGYDKVLVDAECTHDGSLKHISKFKQWGWDTFEHRFFNKERVSSITDLQLQLLSNGFRLLKAGGSLVYSTCSFTMEQNEGVVERFLATQKNAELKQIEEAKEWPCSSGGLNHTLRFTPYISNTNGLFIAKIVKTSPSSAVEEAFSI